MQPSQQPMRQSPGNAASSGGAQQQADQLAAMVNHLRTNNPAMYAALTQSALAQQGQAQPAQQQTPGGVSSPGQAVPVAPVPALQSVAFAPAQQAPAQITFQLPGPATVGGNARGRRQRNPADTVRNKSFTRSMNFLHTEEKSWHGVTVTLTNSMNMETVRAKLASLGATAGFWPSSATVTIYTSPSDDGAVLHIYLHNTDFRANDLPKSRTFVVPNTVRLNQSRAIHQLLESTSARDHNSSTSAASFSPSSSDFASRGDSKFTGSSSSSRPAAPQFRSRFVDDLDDDFDLPVPDRPVKRARGDSSSSDQQSRSTVYQPSRSWLDNASAVLAPSRVVSCPVCFEDVPSTQINTHLDSDCSIVRVSEPRDGKDAKGSKDSKDAKEDSAAKLPVKRFHGLQDKMCPCCHESNSTMRTPCGHFFHSTCLAHSRRHGTFGCPLCRQPVPWGCAVYPSVASDGDLCMICFEPAGNTTQTELVTHPSCGHKLHICCIRVSRDKQGKTCPCGQTASMEWLEMKCGIEPNFFDFSYSGSSSGSGSSSSSSSGISSWAAYSASSPVANSTSSATSAAAAPSASSTATSTTASAPSSSSSAPSSSDSSADDDSCMKD